MAEQDGRLERVADAIAAANAERRYGLYDYSGYPSDSPPHVVRNERTNAVLLRSNDPGEARAYYDRLVREYPAKAAIEATGITALEAEVARLRERMTQAVATTDAARQACPIESNRQRDTSKPCQLCGATASEACGQQTGADYRAIEMIRATLTEGTGA